MTDGVIGEVDKRFSPLADEEPLNDCAVALVPADEETAILHPVAKSPWRIRNHARQSASKIWRYMVDSENVSFLVCRFDQPDGKKEIGIYSRWRSADGSEHWRWKRPPAPLPLYKLPEIAALVNAPVLICEGEKATDAASRIFPDHVTACWQGGANAVNLTDFTPLRGRTIVIWPDNDDPGRAAASSLTSILSPLNCKIRVLDAERASAVTPDRPGDQREPVAKWDAADAVEEWQDLGVLRLALEGLMMEAATPPAYKSCGRFVMDQSGLHGADKGKNGRDLVSAAFEIVGRTRSPEGDGWGKLLRWKDEDGREHCLAVSDGELHGPLAPLVSRLAAEGLRIERSRGSDFADYLNSPLELEAIITVDRTGWIEADGQRAFVLPDRTLGDLGGKKVTLTSRATAEFCASGSLADWAGSVGTLVRGHSRHMLVVAAAFAGPLLGLLGRDGVGISIYGSSSTGKTTAIAAAASCWGRGSIPGFIRTWRNTANGLEGAAALHNDVLLVLDELGQIEAGDVAAAVYQIASGAGKGRATKDGTLKRPQIWRTILLSTGEIRLREKLQEDNRRVTAGQLVRFLEVPADAGKGFGSFDHGGETGEARCLADAIKESAQRFYGTAGPEFVSRLLEKGASTVMPECDAFTAAFRKEVLPENADGQVERTAGAFALVGFAGELATSLGVLPWQEGDARGAAKTCFQAWLEERGGVEAHEIREVVERLTDFINRHGSSRFSRLPGAGEGWKETITNRAGFWRGEGADRQWLIDRGVWRSEVFKGINENTAATILRDEGLLIRNKDGNQKSAKVAGVASRFYAVQLGATTAVDHAEDPPPLLI